MAKYTEGYSDKLLGISNNIEYLSEQIVKKNLELLLEESKNQLDENYNRVSGDLMRNEKISGNQIVNTTPYASILNAKKPWRSEAVTKASSRVIQNYRDMILRLLSVYIH